MANAAEILKLCRLCLVKDQVTIPIFDGQGDVKQIFLKITACLPIKVSRKDCLPKSICNACLLKLEVLYEFWNTTANSEKTLITWLNEAGVDTTNCNAIENNQIIPEEIILKEEAIDVADRDHAVDDISSDAKNYASDQQAPVTYNTPSFEFQNDILNAQGKKESPSKKSNNESSAKRKRAPSTRRRTPTAKAIKYEEETEEESAGEDFAAKVEDDSDYVADNDTSIMGFDQDESIDEPPPTSSASDQPGPSGVQKATGEPPANKEKLLQASHLLKKCFVFVGNMKTLNKSKYALHKPQTDFERISKQNILPKHRAKFKCQHCASRFVLNSYLQEHYFYMHFQEFAKKFIMEDLDDEELSIDVVTQRMLKDRLKKVLARTTRPQKARRSKPFGSEKKGTNASIRKERNGTNESPRTTNDDTNCNTIAANNTATAVIDLPNIRNTATHAAVGNSNKRESAVDVVKLRQNSIKTYLKPSRNNGSPTVDKKQQDCSLVGDHTIGEEGSSSSTKIPEPANSKRTFSSSLVEAFRCQRCKSSLENLEDVMNHFKACMHIGTNK